MPRDNSEFLIKSAECAALAKIVKTQKVFAGNDP
jgi:hypothetical protein